MKSLETEQNFFVIFVMFRAHLISRETFHDNGPTNMPKMLELYKNIGFNGPLRSDHVPTMAGEENTQAGYAMNGNLYSIGYIRGMMDTLEIPYI
jgi:mannonate dehydratase